MSPDWTLNLPGQTIRLRLPVTKILLDPSACSETVPTIAIALLSSSQKMRLINTVTLELEEYIGKNIPPYAILSHTWGDDEFVFSD